MKADKFDELWENVVLPIYKEMNKEGILSLKRSARKRVYKEYQRKKTYIKQNYMKNENTHLDRHKIAACMLFAIMKVYPIRVKLSAVWEKYCAKERFGKEYELLNEYLSLYTAFSIIESFRGYEASVTEEEYPAKGFLRNKISLPETSNGQDYLYNTCLDLYFSKQKKCINVLTFSNVFFLLELLESDNKSTDKS